MKREYNFIGKSVFLEKEKSLIVADLHLGYEETARRGGKFLHLGLYEQIKKDFKRIFGFLGGQGKIINKIIILGDLKHEFSGILREEEREILGFIEYLEGKLAFDGKIILVRGNHDNYVYGILKKKNIEVVEKLIIRENLFVHGLEDVNKIGLKKTKKIKRIFAGHVHPAISIKRGVREEKYKCFVVGKFFNKEIIILPSFFPLVEGIDVSAIGERLNIKKKRVYAVVPESVEVLGI